MTFNEVMEGLYGKSPSGVIIYSVEGMKVWNNAAADKLLNGNPSAEGEILRFLRTSFSDCGNIAFGNGGSYRAISFDGTDCIFVELNCADSLSRFFADPRISEHSYETDMLVRKSLTGISASCELIEAYCGDESRDEVKQCLNHILSSCCKLLQSTTLNSKLAAAVDSSLPSSQCINIDDFLTEIAEGCSRSLPCRCNCVYTCQTGEYITANRSLLTYFTLLLLRPLLDDSQGKEFDLNISCEKVNGRICARFSSEACFSPDARIIDNDVNRIFARKLNADYSYSGNTLTVSFEAVKPDDKLNFESDKVYLSDSVFSVYNVLLSDLDGFRKFYE